MSAEAPRRDPDAPRPWPWWPPAGAAAGADPQNVPASFAKRVPVGELDLSHGVVLYLEDITVSFDGFRALNKLNLTIDAGVAAFFMFAPSEKRSGAGSEDSKDPSAGQRSVLLKDYPDVFPGGDDAQPGVMFLSPESGLGAFYLVSPSVAVRYDF